MGRARHSFLLYGLMVMLLLKLSISASVREGRQLRPIPVCAVPTWPWLLPWCTLPLPEQGNH